MIKIYSDASVNKFKGLYLSGYCTIISDRENNIDYAVAGRLITIDPNNNDLELRASLTGINYALKKLNAKPEELIIYIDNVAAYKKLKKDNNLSKAKIYLIGGDKIKRIDKKIERSLYNACHNISAAFGFSLRKVMEEKNIYYLEEEKEGYIKIIRDLYGFLKREIEPIVFEKAKNQKEVKNTEKLLEESIEDYLNNNKIIGIIRLSENNTRTFTSTKEIMESIRKKKIIKLEKKISEITKESQQKT
jgi:ribonuclease HI